MAIITSRLNGFIFLNNLTNFYESSKRLYNRNYFILPVIGCIRQLILNFKTKTMRKTITLIENELNIDKAFQLVITEGWNIVYICMGVIVLEKYF